MIEFANSDSTIWNRDQLIIELARAMTSNTSRIDLGTKGEGPCARSLGLYDLLDRMCACFNYNASDIYITTCNLAESHNRYNIIIDPQIVYLTAAQKHTRPTSTKQIRKHFGHFIGHSNHPRLYLGSYLRQHHNDQTLQTYHTRVTDLYHRPFIGIEDMMFYNNTWEEVQSAVELLRAAPLIIDSIDQYPILNPTTLNITKVYPEFFVEIVNLTYWSGNTFYIDEKIWRPMLMKTPFMVQGSQNFILNLRRLGFKTFDSWWDEGYSEDPADCQVPAIIKNIKQLSTLTIAQLKDMHAEMMPTLEHNYNRLMTITEQDFIQAFAS
jgi:hypothetical protein